MQQSCRQQLHRVWWALERNNILANVSKIKFDLSNLVNSVNGEKLRIWNCAYCKLAVEQWFPNGEKSLILIFSDVSVQYF